MGPSDDLADGERLLSAARAEDPTPPSAAPQVITAAVSVLDHLNQGRPGRWDFEPVAPNADGRVLDLSWDEGFAVPIVLDDGTLTAVLRLRGAAGEEPTPEEQEDARSFARLLGALISTERAAQQARKVAAEAAVAALSDQLTDLPNDRAWHQALRRESQRCERTGAKAAIAVIDLDDLKHVNDRQGHLAGDLMIRLAADTIAGVVRGADLVARLGGDEFGVLAVDWHESTAAPLVLRLRQALSDREVVASVGGALHQRGRDIMRTFHDADMDMYEAKRVRKGAPARDDASR